MWPHFFSCFTSHGNTSYSIIHDILLNVLLYRNHVWDSSYDKVMIFWWGNSLYTPALSTLLWTCPFKVICMTSSDPYNFRVVKVNECQLMILGSLFIFQLIWLDPRICGCHAELVLGNIQISKIILFRHTNINIWVLCLEHILWNCLLVDVTELHSWSDNIISMAFDCSNSSALAMQVLQCCTKPSIWGYLWNSTNYILPICDFYATLKI